MPFFKDCKRMSEKDQVVIQEVPTTSLIQKQKNNQLIIQLQPEESMLES